MYGYPIMLVRHPKTALILLILMVGVFLTFHFTGYFESGDIFHDGIYANGTYKFFLKFPRNWHPVAKPEKEVKWKEEAWSGLDDRLYMSPSTPEDALMILSIIDKEKSQLPMSWNEMWGRVVGAYKAIGLNVKINAAKEINHFEVYRVGGSIEDYYIEIVLFASGRGIVQMYFLFKEPVDKDMFDQIDKVVSSVSSEAPINRRNVIPSS